MKRSKMKVRGPTKGTDLKIKVVTTAVVLSVLFLFVAFGVEPSQPSAPATYFQYSAQELALLDGLETQNTITQEELIEWDSKAFAVVSKNKLPPTVASKIYANLFVAERDAAIISHETSGRYAGNIAPLAADVLCTFSPSDCEELNTNGASDPYSERLAEIVMQKIRDRKEGDGAGVARSYPQGETFWMGEKPVTPDASLWKTWRIVSAERYLATPPPEYNSPEDLSQIESVKDALAALTEDQKRAIIYWAGGAGTETPGGIWIRILDDYLEENPVDLQKTLDARADLSTAIADAFIACWDTKFTYATKRPNQRDESIVSFIPTPNFPSYTSGHSTISAAAATMLSHHFPERRSEWMRMAEEARDSRLWSGIHFPVDNEVGFGIGTQIASDIISAG